MLLPCHFLVRARYVLPFTRYVRIPSHHIRHPRKAYIDIVMDVSDTQAVQLSPWPWTSRVRTRSPGTEDDIAWHRMTYQQIASMV